MTTIQQSWALQTSCPKCGGSGRVVPRGFRNKCAVGGLTVFGVMGGMGFWVVAFVLLATVGVVVMLHMIKDLPECPQCRGTGDVVVRQCPACKHSDMRAGEFCATCGGELGLAK